MPDEEATKNAAPSPEVQAFCEVLKKAGYDNPEIYQDPLLPQVYKFRIRSLFLPDSPTIIRVEIDGDVLWHHLIEADFNMMSSSPEGAPGYENFAEFRQHAEGDPHFSDLLQTQWRFVLRHFPNLFLSFHAILILSSFSSTWLSLWRENPDGDLNEFETLARSALEKQIDYFGKYVKQIVDTRSKGRPQGSTKSPEDRAKEAEEFEREIEATIQRLSVSKNSAPTKTAVAKALGIGGLNPKTGIDSSLTAFNNKLKRLKIDYNMIVQRVQLNK